MRFDALALVHVLCGVLSITTTDTAAAEPPTPDRVEVAFVGGVILVVPIAGMRVSVPIGHGLAIEGLVGGAPWVARDSADARLTTQWQVRLPYRQTDSDTRAGLLVGVSTIQVLDRFFAGGESPTRLRPHVGSSWQWRRRRGMDLRLDVGIMADVRRPVPLPWAHVAAVFRTGHD